MFKHGTPSRTLFSSTHSKHLNPAGLRRLRRRGGFSDWELDVFESLIRNERNSPDDDELCSATGPLIFVSDGDTVDLARQGRGLMAIPRDVDEGSLQFKRCDARGILLSEIPVIAGTLAQTRLWKRLNLILVSSRGMPTVQTRRFLHRLEKAFKIPVYVLADNDTWGYFIFSVLKRGGLAPGLEVPSLAVKDVRFLAVRAGDFAAQGRENRLIHWEPLWDLRLAAMRKYPCFRGRAWQQEFRRFKQQNGKAELAAFPVWHNERRAQDYLSKKLSRGEWLT
jgi:DNA topoisomerase-6 subunit A